MPQSDIVNFLSLAEPANPADFDINDPARHDLQCKISVTRVQNRLVKTNRRFDRPLQPRM